jgi:WD40 repeat protein
MVCVAFTTDGKSIVTGSDAGTIRVWDPSTGKLRRSWNGHNKAVRQLAALSSDTFASVRDDGAAGVWNATGEELSRLRDGVKRRWDNLTRARYTL